MELNSFFGFDFTNWVLIPLLIFLSRILDVSIGTLRIMFVSRGNRKIAPLLGFIEILIWTIAITQVMQNLNNVACYIAYAAGFSAGNYIGMLIEEKIALGMLVVRVFLMKDSEKLIEKLYESGYGVTTINATGVSGEVKLVYTVIKRKYLDDVLNIINQYASKAFYSVEDVKMVSQGVFPKNRTITNRRRRLLNSLRKGN